MSVGHCLGGDKKIWNPDLDHQKGVAQLSEIESRRIKLISQLSHRLRDRDAVYSHRVEADLQLSQKLGKVYAFISKFSRHSILFIFLP